jgi:hypothetical protein
MWPGGFEEDERLDGMAVNYTYLPKGLNGNGMGTNEGLNW